MAAVLVCILIAEAFVGRRVGARPARLVPDVVDIGDVPRGENIPVRIRVENPGPSTLHGSMTSTCECLTFPDERVVVAPGESATVLGIVATAGRSGHTEVFGQLDANGTVQAMVRVQFTTVDGFSVQSTTTAGESGCDLECVLSYRGKSPPVDLWVTADSPTKIRGLRRIGERTWSVSAWRPTDTKVAASIRLYAGDTELQRIECGPG